VTHSKLLGTGSLVLLVGAIAFGVHIVARSLVTAGPDLATAAREGIWMPINALGALAAVLVLLGLPVLYSRMAGALGWLGSAGLVVIALGWMFSGLFLSFFGVLLAPWLAEQAPSLLAASSPLPAPFLVAFIMGLLAEMLGAVLLAIPFLRGRAQPRWVGFVLVAAAAMLLLGNAIAPAGPSRDVGINLLSNLGPVLLMVGLGALGARTWMARAA